MTIGSWDLGRSLGLVFGNSLRKEMGCLGGEFSMGIGYFLVIEMIGES